MLNYTQINRYIDIYRTIGMLNYTEDTLTYTEQ